MRAEAFVACTSASEAVDALKRWQKQKLESPLFAVTYTAKPRGHLMADAKIEGFRVHNLRHAFASQLVMEGVDLNTVRGLLGHGDVTMTMRYAHLAPEHKADPVERLVNLSKRRGDGSPFYASLVETRQLRAQIERCAND